MPIYRPNRTKPIPIQIYVDEELKAKIVELVRYYQKKTTAVLSISSVICGLLKAEHEEIFSNSEKQI